MIEIKDISERDFVEVENQFMFSNTAGAFLSRLLSTDFVNRLRTENSDQDLRQAASFLAQKTNLTHDEIKVLFALLAALTSSSEPTVISFLRTLDIKTCFPWLPQFPTLAANSIPARATLEILPFVKVTQTSAIDGTFDLTTSSLRSPICIRDPSTASRTPNKSAVSPRKIITP